MPARLAICTSGAPCMPRVAISSSAASRIAARAVSRSWVRKLGFVRAEPGFTRMNLHSSGPAVHYLSVEVRRSAAAERHRLRTLVRIRRQRIGNLLGEDGV